MSKKDLWGKALLDYYSGNYTEDIKTWTSISVEDTLPLPYLFRDFDEMPLIEQQALNLCRGKVLDVGCGAGNHSLWLQHNNLKVKGIDVSEGAIKVCKKRGLLEAEQLSLLEEKETFDTILLLMNGTGIFQELNQVSKYLNHLKSLLNPKGQVLIDSSDISYMYIDETEIDPDSYRDEIESHFEINRDENGSYYGELDYFMSYKGEVSEPFKWLYLDFETLKIYCKNVGLKCVKILDGPHFDYLARLTL